MRRPVVEFCVQKYHVTRRSFLAECRGATAIEYGLIAAAIAVAISAGVLLFGNNLGALFTSSSAMISSGP